MKAIILCVMFLLATSAVDSSYQLTGVITLKSGKPLGGVQIYSRAQDQYVFATTDEKGEFKLRQHGRVVFFQALGHQPVVKIIERTTNKMDVVMEEASSTEFKVLPCSVSRSPESYIGHAFAACMLHIPQGAVTIPGKGNLDSYHTIYYQSPQSAESLTYYWSFQAVGLPEEQRILTAKDYSVQSFRAGKYFGIDIRGLSKDGKHWRFLGDRGGMEISYYSVSKEAADYFDGIISTLCIDQ